MWSETNEILYINMKMIENNSSMWINKEKYNENIM